MSRIGNLDVLQIKTKIGLRSTKKQKIIRQYVFLYSRQRLQLSRKYCIIILSNIENWIYKSFFKGKRIDFQQLLNSTNFVFLHTSILKKGIIQKLITYLPITYISCEIKTSMSLQNDKENKCCNENECFLPTFANLRNLYVSPLAF